MHYEKDIEIKLSEYLATKMPEASDVKVNNLNAASEGSSYETYFLNAEWIAEGIKNHKKYVLRMEPEAGGWEPYDIKPQFLIQKSLKATAIPVPEVFWLELDKDILGKRFFIMEHTSGEVVIPFDSKAEIHTNIFLREEMARNYVLMLAQIHQVPWKELEIPEFLQTPDKPSDYARMEVNRWEQMYYKKRSAPEPVIVKALIWLKSNVPDVKVLTLLHGDYQMLNVLWQGSKISAVLDWENARIGDPMDDIGWICMDFWRLPNSSLVNNLIEREKLYKLYEKFTGMKIDHKHVRYWEIMGYFRLLVILICAFKAFEEGKVKSLRLGVMEPLYFNLLNSLAGTLKI